MEEMFNGPMPGESLTREPGNAPWEQPPQFDKVEAVVGFYLDKFQDDEVLEEALNLFDKGMSIEHFVDSMLLYGEMEGKHTTDASVLAGPVLHKYLTFMADSAGIEYQEFQKSEKPDKLKQDLLAGLDFKTIPGETSPDVDDYEEEEEEEMEEMPEMPKGLIKRRT